MQNKYKNKVFRNKINTKSILLGASCFLALSGPEISYAGDGAALEEIIVTARKRAESLMDVPISVTAFSESKLDRLGATSLIDLKNHIPGLHYSDRGNLQTEITIRGVGGNSRHIGFDSGVGLYIDGVFMGRTSGYNIDLAEIAQLEVLRGPQGTIFGKNTIGGAINITSSKPGDEIEGALKFSYGRFNEVRANGSIGGPLTDTIKAKFTVATWDRDGYLTNTVNPLPPATKEKYQTQNRRAARAQFVISPNEKAELYISMDYTRDDRVSVLNQIGSNPVDVVTVDQRNSGERDLWGASAQLNYNISDTLSFTSITAYRETDILVYSDIDQLPVDIAHSGPFTDISQQFTQELRLSSDGDGSVNFVGGLYYSKIDGKAFRNITLNVGPGFNIIDDHTIEATSYAAFINLDYDIAEKLTLTGGMRVTRDEKIGNFLQTGNMALYDYPNLEVKDTAISWTTSLNYRLDENTSTYATVSRGYKSGGINLDTLTAGGIPVETFVFAPEFVTNFELGFKADFLDGAARLNSSIFYSKYTDRQVSQFVVFEGAPIGTPLTTNAGDARIYGGEVELEYSMNENFRVWASAGYLNGKYTSFENATPTGGSYTGNITERTPDWTFSLGAEARKPVEHGELVAYADVIYRGGVHLQPDNAEIHFEDGYFLLNGRVGYEYNDGNMGIFLWVKNIGGVRYKEFSRSFLGSQQLLYGEPTMYGLQVTGKF